MATAAAAVAGNLCAEPTRSATLDALDAMSVPFAPCSEFNQKGASRDQSIFPSLDAAVSQFALTASKRRLRGADGGLARGAGGGWRPRAAMACRNTSKPCGMAKKTCEKLGRRCRKTYHRGAEPCKIEPLRKSILRGAGEPVRQLADRGGAPAPAASALAWSWERFRAERDARADSVVPVATRLRTHTAICLASKTLTLEPEFARKALAAA